MRVINQWGPRVSDRIRAAVPDVEVVDLARDARVPEGLAADVLFTSIGADWQSPLDVCRSCGVGWVQINGASVEGIPTELADDGRTLTNGRTSASSAISEFVLASMLAFAKRFPLTWIDEPPPPGSIDTSLYLGYDEADAVWAGPRSWGWAPMVGLAGKTLGLVGFGGIAQSAARKALAFDMRVLATRRHQQPSPIPGVEMVEDVRELLPVADHLVLALPLTEATRQLLNAETLALVKPGVHVVNISRGPHIDNDELRRALDDGRVAFASLDVHDPTPLPAGHWLYSHPRVHVSPHLSWVTPEGPKTVEIFTDNLQRYIAGEPLRNVVDFATEGY